MRAESIINITDKEAEVLYEQLSSNEAIFAMLPPEEDTA